MVAVVATSAVSEARRPVPGGIACVLDDVCALVGRENAQEGVRLGALMSAAGRRSYGPLFLIIGLFSISPATILPGMTSFAALLTLLVAGQMALGLHRPWLPRRMLNLKLPCRLLYEFLHRTRAHIDAIDGVWLRERWSFLSRPLFVNVVALCVMTAALITFPLSLIPFAPLAPGIAVVFFGLGMTARDGAWLAIGVAATGLILAAATPMVI